MYEDLPEAAGRNGSRIGAARNSRPACILAQMRASLVIPIQSADGAVKNKTIVVPGSAKVKGKCAESQQWMTLVWNNTRDSGKLVKTAQLTLLFTARPEEQAVLLTHVWATVELFLEKEDNSGMSLISSKASRELIRTTLPVTHFFAVGALPEPDDVHQGLGAVEDPDQVPPGQRGLQDEPSTRVLSASPTCVTLGWS